MTMTAVILSLLLLTALPALFSADETLRVYDDDAIYRKLLERKKANEERDQQRLLEYRWKAFATGLGQADEELVRRFGWEKVRAVLTSGKYARPEALFIEAQIGGTEARAELIAEMKNGLPKPDLVNHVLQRPHVIHPWLDNEHVGTLIPLLDHTEEGVAHYAAVQLGNNCSPAHWEPAVQERLRKPGHSHVQTLCWLLGMKACTSESLDCLLEVASGPGKAFALGSAIDIAKRLDEPHKARAAVAIAPMLRKLDPARRVVPLSRLLEIDLERALPMVRECIEQLREPADDGMLYPLISGYAGIAGATSIPDLRAWSANPHASCIATYHWVLLGRNTVDPEVITALQARGADGKPRFTNEEILDACIWVGGKEAQRVIWRLRACKPDDPAVLWAANGLSMEDVFALMVKHGVIAQVPSRALLDGALKAHTDRLNSYAVFLEVLQQSNCALYFHHECKSHEFGRIAMEALAGKTGGKLPVTRVIEAYDEKMRLDVAFECEGKWHHYRHNSEVLHEQIPAAVEIANLLLARRGHRERFIKLPECRQWYAWLFCDPEALNRLQSELYLPTDGMDEKYRSSIEEKLARRFEAQP